MADVLLADGRRVRRFWSWIGPGAVVVFAVATLLLAGIIHISAILLVPLLAESDGWSRLDGFAQDNGFAEIPLSGDATPVRGLDPLFINAVCRLDLSEDPAGITLPDRGRFWSLALYDEQGTIPFSLNDRTSGEGDVDILVVSPAQNARLGQNPPADLEQTIVVQSDTDNLIALLRLFAPTATAQGEARKMIAAADCVPSPLDEAPPAPAPASGGQPPP